LVPLEAIDWADRLTGYSYPLREDRLRDSIAEVGLITPLILQERGEGRGLRIVCGHRRARACKEKLVERVRAYVWVERVSDVEAFLFSLRENAFHRAWNEVEKGHVIDALGRLGVDDASTVRQYLPFLGVAPRKKALLQYRAIARLDEPTKELVVRRSAPFAVAALMAGLASEERLVLLSLAERFNMNMNRLFDVGVLMEEIADREGCKFADITADASIKALLDESTLSPKEGADRLRRELRRLRYPRRARWESRLSSELRKLGVPPEIAVLPPEGIEEETLSVRFAFQSREELRGVVRRLAEIADSDALGNLLALLREGI
jgi:ParB-like chromosome segregation protein Spo0J